jgi:hypothetical protein
VYALATGADSLLQLEFNDIRSNVNEKANYNYRDSLRWKFVSINNQSGHVLAFGATPDGQLKVYKTPRLVSNRAKVTVAELCQNETSEHCGTVILGHDDGQIALISLTDIGKYTRNTSRASSAAVTTINCDWERNLFLIGSFNGQLGIYELLGHRLLQRQEINFNSPIVSVQLTIPAIDDFERRRSNSSSGIQIVVACYGGLVVTLDHRPQATLFARDCRQYQINYEVNIVRKWIECMDF